MSSVLSDTMMAKARTASLAFLMVFQCLEDGADNWQIPQETPMLCLCLRFSLKSKTPGPMTTTATRLALTVWTSIAAACEASG